MNTDVVRLLRVTPGIVCRRGEIACKESVDFDDWTKMLTMHDASTEAGVGQWVRVVRGPYKGDVGLISAIESWGGVTLLLVPRLAQSHPLSSKRKRGGLLPDPNLFDPKAFIGTDAPVAQTEGKYRFRGLTFEYGLLVQQFDMHSISSKLVTIPSRILSLFRASGHPTLHTALLPKPVEWTFQEDEKVVVKSSGKHGLI